MTPIPDHVVPDAPRAANGAAPGGLPFAEAFEAAGLGMALGGPDGSFVHVNEQMAALTGYSREELLAGGAPLLWTPATRAVEQASLADLWSGRVDRYDEDRLYRRKDGRDLWVSTAATCLRDPAGRPRFVFGQFHDITARIRSQEELRASRDRYDAVLDRIDEVVFQIDRAGKWTFLSSAWVRATGEPVADSLGRPALDFIHPDDRERLADVLLPLFRDGEEHVEFEPRYLTREGETRWAVVEAYLVADPHDASTVGGLIRDVTSVQNAERAADAHIESLVAVAGVTRAMNEGRDARRAVCRAAREVSGASFAALVEPEDGHFVSTAMDGLDLPPIRVPGPARESPLGQALATGEKLFFPDTRALRAALPEAAVVAGARSGLCQPICRDGEVVAILCVAWNETVPELPDRHGAAIALLAAEAGVAIERADLLARLEALARTDPLTGLANRGAWDRDLARELRRAARRGDPICVALLDIDHFKAWNDAHGHQAGDQLLKDAAGAWQRSLRECDLLARWGGEEFAIALPGCAMRDAHIIIERCRTVLPAGVTCSAGLAAWDRREAPEALLGRADAAMYEAKAAGRDRMSDAGAGS